jgi:hypothetical protein
MSDVSGVPLFLLASGGDVEVVFCDEEELLFGD